MADIFAHLATIMFVLYTNRNQINPNSTALNNTFFVALACHWPVLDQHFQATVHFPLSNAIDLRQQYRQFFPLNQISGKLCFKTGAAGPGIKYG